MAPLLPLDIWRAELGLRPWHFWGWADSGPNAVTPIVSSCDPIVREYSWQGSDMAGRDDIRRAIERAERILLRYLQYRPAPQYVEATLPWPRFNDQSLMRLRDVDATGRRIAVALDEGYVQALGIEARTPVGTASVGGGTLVYSAQFNPALQDTFTITLPTALTDPNEIAVYFAAADRFDTAPISERWRIEPVNVSISGGNVIITGRKWLLGKPILYEDPALGALDPQNVANFVTSLEVYRRYTDASGTLYTNSQAAWVYETHDCGWWGGFCCCPSPGSTSTDPAAQGYVVARAGIRDSRLGLVTPAAAVYDATSGTWSSGWGAGCLYEPDRVVVRYLAGYPLEQGRIAPLWQSVMTQLAAAELKRRICACRDTNERLHDLQIDLTLQATTTERYSVAQEDLSNPFGVRKGHVQAWRDAKDRILRRGMLA